MAHPLDNREGASEWRDKRLRQYDIATPADGGLPLDEFYKARIPHDNDKAIGNTEHVEDLPDGNAVVHHHHNYELIYPKPPRRLRIRGSVTLDASGNGTVRFGPVPPGQHWLVERVTLRCSSLAAPVPSFTLYTQSVADANAVDTTTAGNLDTSDNSNPVMVEPGEEIIGVWTGGVVGAIASWNVQYRVEIGSEVVNP